VPLAALAIAMGVLPWQTVLQFVSGTLDHVMRLVTA
jgi:hypothetical protein